MFLSRPLPTDLARRPPRPRPQPGPTRPVRAQVESLLGRTGDAIGIETESGSVHGAVLTIANRIAAGIVVMAPGSAAIRVARSAERPVLIARPSPAGGPIVGATDFSDPSRTAGGSYRGRRSDAARCASSADPLPGHSLSTWSRPRNPMPSGSWTQPLPPPVCWAPRRFCIGMLRPGFSSR